MYGPMSLTVYIEFVFLISAFQISTEIRTSDLGKSREAFLCQALTLTYWGVERGESRRCMEPASLPAFFSPHFAFRTVFLFLCPMV